MIQLVILDRDGVINYDSAEFVKSADEWQPIDGSAEAIGRLTAAGFTVAVASNQSGIGRCLFDQNSLDAIHAKMRRVVERHGGRIDQIVFCPHLPEAACECRKPRAGLLRRLASHYGVSLSGVPVVGDSERDLVAARVAGARPLLVLTGNGKKTLGKLQRSGQDVEVFEDLAAVSAALVGLAD